MLKCVSTTFGYMQFLLAIISSFIVICLSLIMYWREQKYINKEDKRKKSHKTTNMLFIVLAIIGFVILVISLISFFGTRKYWGMNKDEVIDLGIKCGNNEISDMMHERASKSSYSQDSLDFPSRSSEESITTRSSYDSYTPELQYDDEFARSTLYEYMPSQKSTQYNNVKPLDVSETYV